MKFELEWGPSQAGDGERREPRTGISQLCEAEQVETDKWPLEPARPSGLVTVPGVRRGRESFDGFRQITKSQLQHGPEAGGPSYRGTTQLLLVLQHRSLGI